MTATPLMLCALADLKTDVQQENQTLDDAVLLRCITDASDSFQRVTRRTFRQTAPAVDQVIHNRDIVPFAGYLFGTVLQVTLPTPRIQAVSALSYRLFAPSASWIPIGDLTRLDWETTPPESERSSLVYVHGLGSIGADTPLWMRISYTAGWLCDFPITSDGPAATDPPPADLQAIVRWWAQWYYRKKDAPFERTANPLTGAVTIPRSMPDDLQRGVQRWRRNWILV